MYPKIPSVIRPVAQGDDIPVRISPTVKAQTGSSSDMETPVEDFPENLGYFTEYGEIIHQKIKVMEKRFVGKVEFT